MIKTVKSLHIHSLAFDMSVPVGLCFKHSTCIVAHVNPFLMKIKIETNGEDDKEKLLRASSYSFLMTSLTQLATSVLTYFFRFTASFSVKATP